MTDVSCVAVIAIRDEASHIRRAIDGFVAQGIELIIIDNDSTDTSREICNEYLGHGVIAIHRLPWTGVFDLREQLKYKQQVVEQLSHDWVIHADADEWLCSPEAGESLLQGIERVHLQGYNAINFDEFVFLPIGNDEAVEQNYQEMLHYYFFAPQPQRLMRAWRRTSGLQNIASGGHRLTGNGLMIAPEHFILRHYIALSQKRIRQKYMNRKFAPGDLELGWHGNRLALTREQLTFPAASKLRKLPSWDSVDFDRSDPKAKHFWDW